MKTGDKITVHGCSAMVPHEQEGTITRITPCGWIVVTLADGYVLRFDAEGYQLGRNRPFYAIVIPPDER